MPFDMYGSGGGFGGNGYNNQQMNQGLGGLGATQWGHELGNQGWGADSPMRDWIGGFQPDSAGWQGAGGGGGPGHWGQDLGYNPRTGEQGYRSNNTYMGIPQGMDQSFLAGIDPKTGNRYVNMNAMMSQFGGGGGFGAVHGDVAFLDPALQAGAGIIGEHTGQRLV